MGRFPSFRDSFRYVFALSGSIALKDGLHRRSWEIVFIRMIFGGLAPSFVFDLKCWMV